MTRMDQGRIYKEKKKNTTLKGLKKWFTMVRPYFREGLLLFSNQLPNA